MIHTDTHSSSSILYIDIKLTIVIFSLSGVEPLGAAAVLGVVVDEHVVRDGEQLEKMTKII